LRMGRAKHVEIMMNETAVAEVYYGDLYIALFITFMNTEH